MIAAISLSGVGLATAFAAGFISFLSPCVWPLVPAYLSYVSGVPYDELGSNRRRVVLTTLAFVGGFSIVFALYGVSVGYLGSLVADYRRPIEIVGGVLVILMGLALLGFAQRLVGREARVGLPARPTTYVGAGVAGVVFAVGWTPCIGPILTSILLYAATQGQGTNNAKKIIVIDPATKAIETVATDVQPNDLVVSKDGFIYFTDTGAGTVVKVPTSARKMSRPPVAAGGINKPNGIALSPDQRMLVVSEYGGTNAWSFLIATDGSLKGGEKNMELRAPVGKSDSGGDGMISDAQSRWWITSHLGIQMFDANGRMGGIVSRPQEKGTVSCAFAGPGRAWLYACASDKVYRRKTLTEGAKVP